MRETIRRVLLPTLLITSGVGGLLVELAAGVRGYCTLAVLPTRGVSIPLP